MSQLANIRRTLADALVQAQAADHISTEQLAAFIRGDEALVSRHLDLDSLAAMELLVAIELEHGVSLGPEQLATLPSLAALAELVAAKAAVNSSGRRPEQSAAGSAVVETTPATQRAPHIVRLFMRAHAGCRNSVAKRRQLEIELGHRLTPMETRTLCDWTVHAPQHQESLAFCERLLAMCDTAGKRAAEPFLRRRLSRAHTLYQGPDQSQHKELLIAVTGAARRMMVPVPVFLQHLDARRFDVLLLQDRNRDSYQRGLAGTDARRVADIPVWLQQSGLLDQYAGARTIGVSGGGFLAVLIALQLRLSSALCVGGRFPSGREQEYLALASAAKGSQPDAPTPPVLLAYGWWRCGRDRHFARVLAPLIQAEARCIRLGLSKVNHNVLSALQRHSRLLDFLDNALSADRNAGSAPTYA